jgi:hypothetical protein
MKLAEAVCKDGEIALEEVSSGSDSGTVDEARSFLVRRLVTKVGPSRAEAARLPELTTPATARTLKRAGSK